MFTFWIIIFVLVEYATGRPQQILFDNFVDYPKKDNRINITNGTPDQIYFPEIKHKVSDAISGDPVNPTCASGLSFCEDVDSYPYNQVKQVLEDKLILKSFFGKDEVPTEDISKRLEENDETFVCRSIAKTVFPKIGQNNKNEWKFIINQGDEDGFIQGVQIEICKNPNTHCDLPGNFPTEFGYQTTCKQKYVYRRLLSLSNGGMPIPDTFKLPSACCCAYKRNFEFQFRYGKDFTPASRKY